jgi:hypothetical protein
MLAGPNAIRSSALVDALDGHEGELLRSAITEALIRTGLTYPSDGFYKLRHDGIDLKLLHGSRDDASKLDGEQQ